MERNTRSTQHVAELYKADKEYEPGHVMKIGGEEVKKQ